LVALSSTLRHTLSRQDILIALNDSTNAALNAINALIRRNILAERPPGSDSIQARHRVIAELLRRELEASGQLTNAVFGLAFLAATEIPKKEARKGRAQNLLRAVMNHDFLYRTLGLEKSKMLYESIESLVPDFFHYWLQRGSLEVEFGDLRLAENFLAQARGLISFNLFVENEWAYMLFRKAIENPRVTSAYEYVEEATGILKDIIRRPHATPHPFHVLGSQGLAWSRAGLRGRDEKEQYLRGILNLVKTGAERFPKNQDIQQLLSDIQREYLSLTLPGQNLDS
jgi:hypothetical protein